MENELTSAQLALARMIDIAMTMKPGVETTVETMCCRAVLGRGARATVDKAMDLAGGGSFLRRNPLERYSVTSKAFVTIRCRKSPRTSSLAASPWVCRSMIRTVVQKTVIRA